jgi:hypothetical protein
MTEISHRAGVNHEIPWLTSGCVVCSRRCCRSSRVAVESREDGSAYPLALFQTRHVMAKVLEKLKGCPAIVDHLGTLGT